MEMNGEARLAAARDHVWAALNDPLVLKASIPGCEALERDGETGYTTTVVSKVGPVKARFSGRLTLSNIDAPRRYTLTGEGSGGAAGFAKADIDVALEAIEPAVTLLRYGVKAQVGGKLAQLGSRMIDAAARKSADEFFASFAREVGARPAGSDLQSASDPAALLLSPQSLPLEQGLAAEANAQDAVTPTSLPVACADDDMRIATEVLTAGHVKVWIDEHIAVVTLNRPDCRNALSLAMWKAIPSVMAALERNADVRAILLTGAGDDFSAGADIAEFETVRADLAQSVAYERAVDRCCDAIMAVSKPTIAVIRGYCLGGAVHLSMACDFRHASASATFGIPAARLSIVYGLRGTARLLALVGLVEAKRVLYGGARFDAGTALRIGLVDAVTGLAESAPAAAGWWRRKAPKPVNASDPMVDARAFARGLAANAPLSIAGAKTMLDGLAMCTAAVETPAITQAVRRAAASDDYREGRAAFAQKRAPQFTGR